MKWSLRIGTFAGIAVYVHFTFLALLALLGFLYYAQSKSLAMAGAGVGFILSIFACVLLHEFGHALAARRYGIRTRDITLLPIGGLARLERMPDRPLHELVVALAGPLVNVVIAGVLYVLLTATGTLQPWDDTLLASGSFLNRLLAVNVFLVVFNMLPAFPMDGGRVLRALLATRLDYATATNIAAFFGQGFAVLFALWGLFTNPLLLFIALFVWIGAQQEAAAAQIRGALEGIPVARAMMTEFKSVTPETTGEQMAQLIIAGSQPDFPVVAGGEVVGVITRADLLRALAASPGPVAVGTIMRTDFPSADAGEMLDDALRRLQAAECQLMPVLSRGRLVGLLTPENLGEFLMFVNARGGRPGLRA